jgi:hypothetical protein
MMMKTWKRRFGGVWLLLALAACSRSQGGGAVSQDGSSAPSATPAGVTSPTDDWPERYRGKPMLVIVENYALSVVGALSPDKEASVKLIVKRTFGGGDDWRSTVRSTMGWPSNVDAEILDNWKAFNRAAQAQSTHVDPAAFARAFADEFSKY